MTSEISATEFGGLPGFILRKDQTTVTVTQLGAQVVSWRTPAFGEHLYLSPLADFGGQRPIRGGIPICFPQFSDRGPLPTHGFALVMPWERVETHVQPDSASLTLRLTDRPATRALWPSAFEATTTILCSTDALTVTLRIETPRDIPGNVTAGLHTYLRLSDDAAHLVGLAGTRYLDAADGLAPRLDRDQVLPLRNGLDRIYEKAPPTTLVLPSHTLRAEQTGFPDTIVWKPGPGEPRSVDLPASAWRDMVCVEPVALSPGEIRGGTTWEGRQRLMTQPNTAIPTRHA